MAAEISVKVNCEEVTLSEKFLEYGIFSISENDPTMNRLVEQTLSKFKGDVENPDIIIKIKYTWPPMTKEVV